MVAKFRISEKDYTNAQKLHRKLTLKRLLFISLIGCGLMLAALLGKNAIQSVAIGGFIGGIGTLLLMLAIAPYIGRNTIENIKRYKKSSL